MPQAFQFFGHIAPAVFNVDPTLTNDMLQGWQVGDEWYNTTNFRVWKCVVNTPGAAYWAFDGAAYGAGGIEPSSVVTQAGSSTASFPEEGNVSRQVNATGVQPGATGADNVLAVYSMPANAFDGSTGTNRGIAIQAQGVFGNNTNAKRVKIYWGCTTAVVGSTVTGGVVICDSGSYTTTGANGFILTVDVFKYGLPNSNTQLGLPTGVVAGGSHLGLGALNAPIALTATENAPILIAVTGNAATATTDITWNFLQVNFMN